MTGTRKTVISVDAMGGDNGPVPIVKGLNKALKQHADVFVLLHGPKETLVELTSKYSWLSGRIEICDAPNVVEMTDKPSSALRHRKDTSMANALNALKEGRATTAISCGNTGALMAMSTVILQKIKGVDRPAIAIFWPSLNAHMYNVVLDVGADIRAKADDLCAYAYMGAAYAQNAFDLSRPRIGLLNIGTEDHKGRSEVKAASDLLSQNATNGGFEYVGFVEGDHIASDRVDVVVTDGFAGNIALKTAEGTAKVIAEMLRNSFAHSSLSRFASLFAITSMRRLKRRIDPRHANGGVFLGLQGTVIKSHGDADSTGIAAALDLAIRLDQNGFTKTVADKLSELSKTN
ncbi:MAG: phosphate acyltransferase PlsX [Pseudomonadota bacterium]